MEKFKPNQAVEMDVMKSLLDDISKLNYFIELFDDGKSFWIQQINQDLYLKLKENYEELKDQTIIDVSKFYDKVILDFEQEFPNYNLEIYEELYSQSFDFYKVLSNYKNHIVRKEIIQLLNDLKTTFENEIDLNPTKIMSELNLIRKRFETILK